MRPEEPPTAAEKMTNRLMPLWLMILGSGLTAGVIGAACAELTYRALHKEAEYPANIAGMTGSEQAIARGVARFNTKKAVAISEAAVAFGLLGLALGSVLGIAGGLAAGSGRASGGAAIAGGILGGVAGAGLSMVIVPLYFEYSNSQTAPLWILLTHAAIFAGVGAAGGIALGAAWGGRAAIFRCVAGGIAGALLGTLVVDIINVVAFGIARVFEPVPGTSAARFVLAVGIALFIVLGASLAGRRIRGRPS